MHWYTRCNAIVTPLNTILPQCVALLHLHHLLFQSISIVVLYVDCIFFYVYCVFLSVLRAFVCQFKRQESPAVADKPARRLRKVYTVYVRAVGL